MKLTHITAIFFLAACGGSDKPVEEPVPVAEDTTPPPVASEETPPASTDAPVTEPAVPAAPEPKTLSEDLDGDGTADAVSLTGTELKIGEAVVALPAEKLAGKDLQIMAVDLNAKDKSKELVLVDPGVEDDATWYVVVYAKGVAAAPVEVFVGSQPDVKGDGKLTTTNGNCGQTTTVTWKLAKGKLTKGKEKKSGKHDPAKCAG